VALLREAVDAHERSVDVFERARSLADLGSALSRHGQRVQARVTLREASRLAEACGAVVLKRSAHAELVAAGGKPRARALSGVEALTAAERRVAELASRGLTNREIAGTLFVSSKTVEAHLRRTYAKLAIRSRSQLEHALGRRAPGGDGLAELRGSATVT
jgi:DNA-binding CsgD family transcriptional regulator